MERRRQKRRPRFVARIVTAAARLWRWSSDRVVSGWHVCNQRLRPWRPVVLVDARRGRARRLRRMLSRATRMQFRALGVAPPAHLLIVVQRTVQGEHPLASLLQVFEDANGVRRHVLFLGLTVGEESMSDGAIVATLRQQLHEVVGDALGPLARSVACEPPRTRRPAPVVPIRRQEPEPPPFEDAPPPDDTWNHVDDDAYAVAAER